MMELQEYTEGGFELNEPDYQIDNIYFVGTCGSFPEQYSCYIIDSTGKKLQVGYIRLRGGKLSVSFPDAGGDVIYAKMFDCLLGQFRDEYEREWYLEKIAEYINKELIKIGVNDDRQD